MRSLEGSWSAPVVGLVLVVLAGGCAGGATAGPRPLGDAGPAGDAGAGWPVVSEPMAEDPPVAIAERHAHDVCAEVGGCPSSAATLRGPSVGDALCTAAMDCASGRCVRGVCTTGRAGEPCDAQEQCETFCNLATHRCGDFCVDPRDCR